MIEFLVFSRFIHKRKEEKKGRREVTYSEFIGEPFPTDYRNYLILFHNHSLSLSLSNIEFSSIMGNACSSCVIINIVGTPSRVIRMKRVT